MSCPMSGSLGCEVAKVQRGRSGVPQGKGAKGGTWPHLSLLAIYLQFMCGQLREL